MGPFWKFTKSYFLLLSQEYIDWFWGMTGSCGVYGVGLIREFMLV
jgi:hypothetical protein